MIYNPRDGEGARWFGLYPALVSDLVDPEGLGRIQVRFPSFGSAGDTVTAWATLLSPYADQNQGLEILPEVDSQVVVGFEAGDPHRPYILGACWNGRAALPEAALAANNLRTLRTRSGSQLQFDDTQGAAKITLSTQGGHSIELDEGAQSLTITHLNGCKIEMNIAGQVSITANATLEITAASVNVHAPMVSCDGVVQCQSLITNSVISPSYTPGAGNIW